MPTYYNDNDQFVTNWLRTLMSDGRISSGLIDSRMVQDVQPQDLKNYNRCHFFAGIAGWEVALQLAGWPQDQEVWTGSCPCQPWSVAGKRKRWSDSRHVWPDWYGLIKERRPATIFGEQVASRDGRKWLNGVFADLEKLEYAVAGADLCAASVGAPHIRQRLWWVAHTKSTKRRSINQTRTVERRNGISQRKESSNLLGSSGTYNSQLDHSSTARRTRTTESTTPIEAWDETRLPESERRSRSGMLGHPVSPGLEKRESIRRLQSETLEPQSRQATLRSDFWTDSEYLPCLDGKSRRTQPGLFPLAHGISSRVGRLRAYGNSIVPQVAAAFVMAYMDVAGL